MFSSRPRARLGQSEKLRAGKAWPCLKTFLDLGFVTLSPLTANSNYSITSNSHSGRKINSAKKQVFLVRQHYFLWPKFWRKKTFGGLGGYPNHPFPDKICQTVFDRLRKDHWISLGLFRILIGGKL